MSPNLSEEQCSIAIAHPERNRNNQHLPCTYDRMHEYKLNWNYNYLILADHWRVILRDEHPDYIHAVFINVNTYNVIFFRIKF